MTIGRRRVVATAILATVVGSTSLIGSSQADPGAAPGDPTTGMVLVIIDRSGSMHNPGMNCIDENGAPITTPIRKWECAMKAAKFRIAQGDAAKTKRYFLWAFGTLVNDPTNLQIAWNIDKNGNTLKDGSGMVLPGAVTDSLAMSQVDIMAALNALDTPSQGPSTDDCGTPLAGAYCGALYAMNAYRGSATDDLVSVVLESDGLENSTPSGMTCQGDDSFAAGYNYVQGDPSVVDLTFTTTTPIYILTADGLLVPSWQSNMLDVAVKGILHAPDSTGKVLKSTLAFQTPPGVPNFVTNISFLKDFVSSGAQAAAALSVDIPPARVRTSSATASATPDPDLSYFKGLADISGGRLITFGDGKPPTPGDVTAPHVVPGDINDSGCVDAADFNVLKQFYNQTVTPSQPLSYAADINMDARIDINDYLMLKADYGKGCATPPGPVPVLQQSILGFDSLASWSSSQATLALVGLPRTEGDFSMSIGNTGFRTLNSSKFSTSILQGVTSTLALDVAPAKKQTNPYWIGQVLFFASCPSANITNQFIGSVELTGKPLGSFSTIKVAIPLSVKNAMLTSHPDFSFSISLNANDPGYLIDNLRFVP